jgi:hypothetical protein
VSEYRIVSADRGVFGEGLNAEIRRLAIERRAQTWNLTLRPQRIGRGEERPAVLGDAFVMENSRVEVNRDEL